VVLYLLWTFTFLIYTWLIVVISLHLSACYFLGGSRMRMFPVYAPKLIVKHARIFLSGVIWVKDLGLIEFDKGRFLQTKKSLPEVKQAISELNALIEIQSKQH
tara:strand:- start:865 stop:1173 length:309 start_codon:yes stop_codon:yes gene_type:complete